MLPIEFSNTFLQLGKVMPANHTLSFLALGDLEDNHRAGPPFGQQEAHLATSGPKTNLAHPSCCPIIESLCPMPSLPSWNDATPELSKANLYPQVRSQHAFGYHSLASKSAITTHTFLWRANSATSEHQILKPLLLLQSIPWWHD